MFLIQLLTTIFVCCLSVSDIRTRTIPGWAAPVFGLAIGILHLVLTNITALQLGAGLLPGMILLVLSLVFVLMIPQLIDSVKTFSENLDGYVASMNRLIDNLGLAGSKLDISRFLNSSESLLGTISGFITDNLDSILATSLGAGKSIVTVVIGFIFSVYILMDKRHLKEGACRLLRASFGTRRYDKLMVFLKKCHAIFNSYIVCNLIDCIIIGIINFIFMTIAGMEYAGLVSVIVAVTNLIPTFGPIIGVSVGPDAVGMWSFGAEVTYKAGEAK
jgi:predicted PurR-regulated permease PerM